MNIPGHFNFENVGSRIEDGGLGKMLEQALLQLRLQLLVQFNVGHIAIHDGGE